MRVHYGPGYRMYFTRKHHVVYLLRVGGDRVLIRRALNDITRAKGMTQIARDTGLGRESLYNALGSTGNPEFATIMKVMKALGLKLHATAA